MGRHDVRLERGPAADPRRRGALLQIDLALLRDERQAVREPHPHPRALEDRRHRAFGGRAAEDLLRERGQAHRLAPLPLLTSGPGPDLTIDAGLDSRGPILIMARLIPE